MSLTKNEFNLLYAIKKHGIQSHRKLRDYAFVSTGYISEKLREFTAKGFVDKEAITEKGLNELLPYKVDNAVIMAAGLSSRFVPLSLEKPKGLLIVKNEILIERQIEQLQEAGIKNIILILGYKKEAFFYLESKYENLKIIINPEYNKKNNTYTLFLAKNDIKNSYICSSDDYFEDNPFEEYVYQSYYAAVHVNEKTNEWYMIPDEKGNILRVEKSGFEGDIMLGHAYWDRYFSSAIMKIISESQSTGIYDQNLWEQVLADNVKKLPPMEIRVYPQNTIFEFDSLDDLRSFDNNYVEHTHSKIIKNITHFFSCSESNIAHFQIIKDGLTNTTLLFEIDGKKYVYRHPKERSEEQISPKQEKKALEIAKEIGIDNTCLYIDEQTGWKISNYVEKTRIPDYGNFEDSKRIAAVLQKLHQNNFSADWSFHPWEEACKLENKLRSEKGGIFDQGFELLKDNVRKCYQECEKDGIPHVFCHCDTYAQNWMLKEDGSTFLIDWEYAANADPGCDVGSYIMDSRWTIEEAKIFIQEYLGEKYNKNLLFHYLGYTAVVSFYWYVWALHREACGVIMGDSLYNWRSMAFRYSKELVEKNNL